MRAKPPKRLIDAHTPDWVLSVGFSGALPGNEIGDLVMANSIVDTHGNELTVDRQNGRRSAKTASMWADC